MNSQVMGWCESCLQAVADRPGAYREIKGWEQLRAQGGANKISEREQTGKVMHRTCFEERVAGLENQLSMWT